MSDEDLVAASRRGDWQAYAGLVRRHGKRIYAVCMGILGNVTDSEDVLQETFVRGMTRIDTLRDASQFSSWIAQIARNLCRDHLRTHHRRYDLLRRWTQEPVMPDDDFGDLHSALRRLPEKHRVPLMLFYFDGKSTENLARELNITEAGAYTRLHRARKELRRLLAGQGDVR
jgi:RNA polymerase sigma-70 factor (ECF subfamily)